MSRTGAKRYRVCAACGQRKANTVFRCLDRQPCGRGKGATSPVCITCEGGYDGGLHASRVPYDAWMRSIGATRTERLIVREAVKRYGRKAPCPDDVLEQRVRDRQRFGLLWHATVLLAHETRAGGRRAMYSDWGKSRRA